MASADRLRAMCRHYVGSPKNDQEDLLHRAMGLSHEDYGKFARSVLDYADRSSVEVGMPPKEKHIMVYVH